MSTSASPWVTGLALRAARPDDALSLSVLAMQVFLDTYATQGVRPAIAREVLTSYSERVFRNAIASDDERVCVAEADGHLIGFAQVMPGAGHALAPPGAPAELRRLYVQQPFAGRGVGTRLLGEAEGIAAQAGASVLWLTAWVHNHRARDFYRHRGYEDRGLTAFTFEGETHDNRLYAKAIAAGPGA